MSKNEGVIQTTKEALEKANGRAITDLEARKAQDFIELVAKIVLDNAFAEAARSQKLLEQPDGFHLEGGHTCTVCQTVCADHLTWYDSYGIKCVTCQAAINKKIIPHDMGQKPDSFYTEFEMEHCFNTNKKVLASWIKGGILKARIVRKLDRGNHATFFLIKDNKSFLPPKKLVESTMIKEGNEYVFPIPWYSTCPDPLSRIRKYGIAPYLFTAQQ